MSLFDELYFNPTSSSVSNCPHCRSKIEPQFFQTKSFYCAMEKYYVATSATSVFKLGELKESLLRPLTREECDLQVDYVVKRQVGDLVPISDKVWEDPNNYHKFDMGELPHQWVTLLFVCGSCGIWTDIDLKFTDGKLNTVRFGEVWDPKKKEVRG